MVGNQNGFANSFEPKYNVFNHIYSIDIQSISRKMSICQEPVSIDILRDMDWLIDCLALVMVKRALLLQQSEKL